MSPFEITPEDIIGLDDNQLRRVLNLLLEAEAKKFGVPLSAIRLGSNQSSADGGEDARVEWEGPPERTDWFQNRYVSFQSKAEKMPPSALKRGMTLKGILRPVFGNLAETKGTYVVFSTDNCSERMYTNRIKAMREVVDILTRAERIYFELYDASRVARWVNCFPGVAFEVRTEFGRPMVGWRHFENWSAPQIPTSHNYLIDEKPKMTFGGNNNKPVSIIDAIDQFRSFLSTPGIATRE